LTLLAWLTVVVEQPRIEADLTKRTHQALQVAGLGWAGLEFSGRDGWLAGDAYDEAEPEKALQIAQKVWGVRALQSDIAVVEKSKDYPWRAERGKDGIRLTGYIPDEARREAVHDMVTARFPDTHIDDQLTIKRGAPETEPWLASLGFALDRLVQIKSGAVELRGLGLTISGEATNQSDYRSAKQAIARNMPAGASLIRDDLTPPAVNPYTWGMQKTAAQFVLTGHVPDAGVRAQLFDKAKAAFPKLAIIDRMELASGAGEKWFEAASAVLAALGTLQEGEATVSAGDIVLRGRVSDEAGAARAAATLTNALPHGFKAKTDLTFPPPAPPVVSPYTTRIETRAGSVVLSGFIPSNAARAELLGHVKRLFPEARLFDGLALGTGAAEGWQSCVSAGLEALARLRNGSLALSDRSIHVTGRTQDEALAEALPAQVRAAANRACESKVEIALDVPPEPNLRWRATNSGEGEIVLEGEIPDEKTEALLVAAVGENFSGARLVNRMTVASGRSEKWQKVAVTALHLLAKLRRGEAVLDGQVLTLSGEASDTSVAAAVKDQLSHTLAKGYTGQQTIEVRSEAMIWAAKEAKRRAAESEAREAPKAPGPSEDKAEAEGGGEDETSPEAQEDARRKADEEARRRSAEGAAAWSAAGGAPPEGKERTELIAEASRCEQHLRSAAAAGTIRFRFASARLDRTSIGTLDRLANIAKGCPKFRIEVIGHTDAIGPADGNQELSEARAEVVVNYLAGAGIEAARLTAIGYGETRPLVPNTSANNRAKNRRIEFSVKLE
jgi:outer membrane protein OmpA-like peptidoglycan-associated protein